MSSLTANIPETANNSGQKRFYSHDENGFSVNPTKKLRFKSSICIGFEKGEAADGKRTGLFQYFRKASQEDRKEYGTHTTEEQKEWVEKVLLEESRAKKVEKIKIRDGNRDHKRCQQVNLEIKSGLRSPWRTKRQVRRHGTFHKFFINSLAANISCDVAT